MIVTIALIAVVLASGAGVIGLLAYEKVAGPDRSTPTVALRQYLYAAFVEKSADRIALFACAQPDETVRAAPRMFDPEIDVSWGGLVEATRSGGRSLVRAQLKLSSGGFTQVQAWEYELVDQQGWRVCQARQIS
jgi:hypothetical protein